MNFLNYCEKTIAIIKEDTVIKTGTDLLDLMAEAVYSGNATGILIGQNSLPEEFFDLKTGLAGDMLQKCSNYRMKLAVIGDFSGYESRALRDFIRECNRGTLIFFKGTEAEALEAMTR